MYARLVQEPNGASRLLVLLRDDKVNTETVIEAITRMQNQPSSKMKRFMVTLLDLILPG